MEFKLRWENPNTFDTVVNIYRGVAALSFSTLGSPIATLSNGETEWVDRDLVYGNTYYYMLTVTANGQTIPTLNQTFRAVNRRGIGPESIIAGDDRLGYMGTVTYDEAMDVSDLFASINTVAGLNFSGRPLLHKYIRNGKILYVSPGFRYTYNAALTWDVLYQAGAVFGTDDAGPADRRGNNPPIIQNAGMIHKGDRYRIRLPRGITDETGAGMIDLSALSGPVTHDSLPNTPHCEFNDIGYLYSPNFPEKMRTYNFGPVNGSNYLTSANDAYQQGGMLCQERDAGENGLILTRTLWPKSGVSLEAAHTQMVNPRQSNSLNWWAPIIELVEE